MVPRRVPLSSQPIPPHMVNALRELGDLKHLRTTEGSTKLAPGRRRPTVPS
jgi:hypothetical protein